MHVALEIYRAAQRELGNDLGGLSLTDLLADQFPDISIDECASIARQLLADVGTIVPPAPRFKHYRFQGGEIDDTGAIQWWVLPGQVEPDRAIALVGSPFEFYGGPGAQFAGRPVVRSTRTRTLVTQRVGLDV